MKRMIESLKNTMVHAGAGWILWLLIALSCVALTIAIDRLLYLTRRNDNPVVLAADLHKLLQIGDRSKALVRLQEAKSLAAVVVAAGLVQWDNGPKAVEEALAAAKSIERAALERRLGVLGTIGNNAPFVGLLGTVIGVVEAFEALGHGGDAGAALGPERVMGSIAEALVATAVGLVVAIPAVALFNYLQGRVTEMIESAEMLGHVLLSHLEGADHAHRHAAASMSANAPSDVEHVPRGVLLATAAGAAE
jgi:biopolymer transport protein ExbB